PIQKPRAASVYGRAWYQKRPPTRTENCHSNDTALQVDERTAFGRWTECQVKANKAVDGSTANAVPSPTRQSDDTERGEWLAFMIPHRHDDLTSAQLGLGGCRYPKSVPLETTHRHISGGGAARERSVCDPPPPRQRNPDGLCAA